jgi:Putative transposase
VFTLQTLPGEPDSQRRAVAESSGFSLHAGVVAKASQRDRLEHLARYVTRPPVATERLSLSEGGLVRCALKTPYRDGTTPVIFEPEDFIARLAARVPKPRAHLVRYHGVFAPANDFATCPLPPPPNRMAARVDAGELTYDSHHAQH